jgi:hypothetical protein
MSDELKTPAAKWKIVGQTRNSRPIFGDPGHPMELEAGAGYNAADHIDAYYYHMDKGNKESNIPASQAHMRHAMEHKERAEQYRKEFVKSLRRLRERLAKQYDDEQDPNEMEGFSVVDPSEYPEEGIQQNDEYSDDQAEMPEQEAQPTAAPAEEPKAEPKRSSVPASNIWQPRSDYSPEEKQAIDEHVKQGYSEREAERLAGAHRNQPRSPEEAIHHPIKPNEPSQKMIDDLRDTAHKHLERSRQAQGISADPRVNPQLYARAHAEQARAKYHEKFDKDFGAHLDSIKHLSGREHQKQVSEWKKKYRQENPEYHSGIGQLAQEEKEHGHRASLEHAKGKEELINFLLHGSPEGSGISDEAIGEYMGSPKDTEGQRRATIEKDPAVTFREQNPEFLKILERYKQNGHPVHERYHRIESARAQQGVRKPGAASPETSKPAPIVTDPGLREKLGHFVTEHMPTLRGVHGSLKNSGLVPDHSKPNQFMPEFLDGLMRAVKSYDKEKEGGANFRTYSSRLIGHAIRDSIQRSKPASQQIPKPMRQAAQKLKQREERMKQLTAQPAATPTAPATTPSVAKPEGEK